MLMLISSHIPQQGSGDISTPFRNCKFISFVETSEASPKNYYFQLRDSITERAYVFSSFEVFFNPVPLKAAMVAILDTTITYLMEEE